jgi:carboxypeptidase family protein
MLKKFSWGWIAPVVLAVSLPVAGWSQSFNATISGSVTDPSGASVPDVELTLTAVDTGAVAKTNTGPDGLFAFPNLQRGAYELKASAKGFRDFVQRGIALSINDSVRLDIKLELGAETQTVEVLADASPLNFDNGELKGAITPESIQALPLLVSGAVRSSASFIILQPGVNTGGTANPFNARVNGGLQSGDEAVLDGITMQQGLLNQSGMVSIYTDFPVSPESVGEVSILTSNYEPQYGSTTSSVITATTKSGTSEFHGGGYWFHRNTVLNARPFGTNSRPRDLEHDFGAYIGGPVKIPKLNSDRSKTYFFVNFEGYRFVGGVRKPILSLPTLKMRNGDFSEWPFPIYDPATTRPDGTRDQFMGCDGRSPNVICPNRIANSLAKNWLQYVPEPNRPGLLDNYEVPVPLTEIAFANSNAWDVRVDHHFREKDQVSVVLRYRGTHPFTQSELPPQISITNYREPNYSFVDRLNWDHTFSPTKLNHLAVGYLDLNTREVNISDTYLDAVPQIAGVASNVHQPRINFLVADGGANQYSPYGGNAGGGGFRPTAVINDLFTWVRGRHTFKFGGEYRWVTLNNYSTANSSGTFNFTPLTTGLRGVNSGNAIASFLLETVSSSTVDFRSNSSFYPRADVWIGHFGDTWKVTPKLSLSYGLRWDMYRPSVEKFDRTSFFDFGPNPSAGNRPGRLAFAGDGYGAASAGVRHPEETWKKGFAPRLGIAYQLTPNTVIRTGYGIFYTQAFYPGWGGGIVQDGFNKTQGFSSKDGGFTPAFLLSQGFPQDFQRPPFIDSGYLNGQTGPNYRPFDANRLSYSQQWNLTVEQQFSGNFYISAAYVGNKGTRLASQTAPLNALDPRLLSMGERLYDKFQPGQTELDGVPIPYPGWVEQMSGCGATVAQALLPYPQYCGGLLGLNENAGNSTYHSFQLKAEKRFSEGLWLLTSYTLSKLLTTSENTQQSFTWSGAVGVISPYERQRNKGLSVGDVPQILSVALSYELPIGRGKRLLNQGGVVDKVLGGWQISNVFRASSGIPFFFRSGQCNVPSQFRVGCIPAIKPGADPFAQDKGNFEPSKPLFNKDAFESADSFNFYYGNGPRVTDLRGFGFYNHDFSLIKNTRIAETVTIQIRAEFFNLWNWHNFNNVGTNTAGVGAFNTDVSSPNFGMWNGNVSSPRNIQVGAKVFF